MEEGHKTQTKQIIIKEHQTETTLTDLQKELKLKELNINSRIEKERGMKEEIKNLKIQFRKEFPVTRERKSQTENKIKSKMIQTIMTHQELEQMEGQARKEIMDKFKEEISKKEKQIIEQGKDIEKYKQKLENIEVLDLPQISIKLHNIEKRITEKLENLINETTKITKGNEQNEKQIKNIREESNLAIIIRNTTSGTSLGELKEMLNRELKDENNLPTIYCRKTRRNNMLIIK